MQNIENAQNAKSKEFGLSWKLAMLIGIFVAVQITANVSAVKIIKLGSFILPAGSLLFGITFLSTDIITEVWGRKWGQRTIWFGFMGGILAMLYLQLTVWLPFPEFWEGQEAIKSTLALVPRITIASLVTYLVSQNLDVWMFSKLKDKTKGKHLWLRNNLSTMTAQLVDSALFATLAFFGTMSVKALVALIFGQYLFKVIVALLDTPFCYLGVRWAKK